MTTEIKEIRKELETLKSQTRQLLNDFNEMMREKSESKPGKKYKDPRSEKELKEISDGAEMTTHMKINLTSHDKSVFF